MAIPEAIQALYDAATGAWDSIDWTELHPGGTKVRSHGYRGEELTIAERAQYIADAPDRDEGIDLDGKTEAILLEEAEAEMSDEARAVLLDCATRCERVEACARYAEACAAEALEHIEADDWYAAANKAEEAARTEREFGDDPTWGRFARAVRAAVKDFALRE